MSIKDTSALRAAIRRRHDETDGKFDTKEFAAELGISYSRLMSNYAKVRDTIWKDMHPDFPVISFKCETYIPDNCRTERIAYIYGLCDPETGLVMYVGRSFAPCRRRYAHEHDQDSNPIKRAWLDSLSARGLSPHMVYLEKTVESHMKQREKEWISRYEKLNPSLVNDRGVLALRRKHQKANRHTP